MLDHALNPRIGQRTSSDTLSIPRYNSSLPVDDPDQLPENAFPNQLVFDEADGKLKVYNRTTDAWDAVGGTEGTINVEEWSSGPQPLAEDGEVGDFHLRDDGMVLEKTDAVTWTERFSIAGPQGVQGEVGPQGEQGIQGPQGQQGIQGPQGIQGDAGPQGVQGPVGDTGTRGTLWFFGQGAPTALTFNGVPVLHHDVYEDRDNGNLYRFDAPTTQWIFTDNITGPEGPVGPQGLQGDQGIQGKTGLNWRGVWNMTLFYVVDDAVYYDGSSYRCIDSTGSSIPPSQATNNWALLALQGDQGPVGPEGPQGDQGPQGQQGIRGLYWEGPWSPTTAYGTDGAVTYGGATYRRRIAGTTSTPPDADPTNWELLAAKGDVGPQGEQGEQGIPGASALPLVGTRANRPASVDTTGQTYYETDTFRTYIWTGSAWSHQAGETAGVIKPFAGWNTPNGYLNCNGTFKSQSAYPELFAVCGHAFNNGVDPGDGTFKLPDYTDRAPVGASATKALGTRSGSGVAKILTTHLPTHQHGIAHSHTAFFGTSTGSHANRAAGGSAGSWYESGFTFTNQMNNTETGNGSAQGLNGTDLPVQNPYQSSNFIIKF